MDGSRIGAFGKPEDFRFADAYGILLLPVPVLRLQGVTAEGRAMRRKMWPVYSAAIKELFEDHIAEREAAQMEATLRRILDAVRDRAAHA